jgi:hypothetical protein
MATSMDKTRDQLLKALSLAHSTSQSDRRRATTDIKSILKGTDVDIPTHLIEDLLRVLSELLFDDCNDCAGNCIAGLGLLVANPIFPSESETFVIDILSNSLDSRPTLNIDIVLGALYKIAEKKTLSCDKLECIYRTFMSYACHPTVAVKLAASKSLCALCSRSDFTHKVTEVLDLLLQQMSSDTDAKVRGSAIIALGTLADKSGPLPADRLESLVHFMLQSAELTKADQNRTDKLALFVDVNDLKKEHIKERLSALSLFATQVNFPSDQLVAVYEYARRVFETNAAQLIDTATLREALCAIYAVGSVKAFPEEKYEDIAIFLVSVLEQNDSNQLRQEALGAVAKLTRKKIIPESLIDKVLTIALGKTQSRQEAASTSGIQIMCYLALTNKLPEKRVAAVVRVLRMFVDAASDQRRIWVMSGFADLCYHQLVTSADLQDIVLKIFMDKLNPKVGRKERGYAMRGVGNIIENSSEVIGRHLNYVDTLCKHFLATMELEVDANKDDDENKSVAVWSMGELIKHNFVPLGKLDMMLLRLMRVHIDASCSNIGISAIWSIQQWGASANFPQDGVVPTIRKLVALLDTEHLKFRSIDAMAAIVVHHDLKGKDAVLADEVKAAIKVKYDEREEYFKGNGNPLGTERREAVVVSMEALLKVL